MAVGAAGGGVDHSITMMRERILDLEAAIERRYLKPPLGNNVGEVNLAMLAQNQDGTTGTGTGSVSGTSTPAGSASAAAASGGFGAVAVGQGASGHGLGGGIGGGNGQQVASASQQSNASDHHSEDGSEPENISKGERGRDKGREEWC